MRTAIVKKIAFKDLTISFRSGAFWLLSGIMILFFGAALWVGYTNYRQAFTIKSEAIKTARHQWENQGEKNPHGAGHFGSVAFKPVSPLHMIETGISDYVGEWVYQETHKQNEAEKRPINDRTALFRFGQLTPAFLLQFLLPLFVVLLGYSAFSAEKEQHTLRLLLSHQVGYHELLLGKFLGVLIQLAFILIPFYAAVTLLVNFSSGPAFMPSLFLLFTAYFFYLITFACISLGVSARSNSSGKALLLVFAFWMGTAVLLPRLTGTLSEILHPTPSSFELKESFDQAQNNKYVYGYKSRDNFAEIYNEIEQGLMEEYGVSHADSLEVNPFGLAIEKTEEEGQKIYEKTYGQINTLYHRQNNVHRWSALFSPLSAIQFFSMGLSHNDQAAHNHFLKEAEDYRRKLMKTLNLDIAYNSRKGNYNVNTRSGLEYMRGEDFWKSIPEFQYQMLPLKEILCNHAIDIASLGIWLLMAVGFMIQSVKNLEVN